MSRRRSEAGEALVSVRDRTKGSWPWAPGVRFRHRVLASKDRVWGEQRRRNAHLSDGVLWRSQQALNPRTFGPWIQGVRSGRVPRRQENHVVFSASTLRRQMWWTRSREALQLWCWRVENRMSQFSFVWVRFITATSESYLKQGVKSWRNAFALSGLSVGQRREKWNRLSVKPKGWPKHP